MTTPIAARWREIEITLTADAVPESPYTTVEAWAIFRHESGKEIRRPAFWDGGSTWRVRFASPGLTGRWQWQSYCESGATGLHGQTGQLEVIPAPDEESNRFWKHGFWRMSPEGRNLLHANGRPAVLCGDTAWALPWRATPEQVREYARHRQAQGFNTALFMTIQPDRGAEGPTVRTEPHGFARAFADLPQGHINELLPGYFQELDILVRILTDHGIAPAYCPVFHGYGWKGLNVAGPDIPPMEYARFCRYLVARYGALPAIWLIQGDSHGEYEQLDVAGWEVEAWDAYGQPTGLHYGPDALNRSWQDREWLDFQWCQTGHNGNHVPERVADMWRNEPPKGVANGEPSYENHGQLGKAAGWWQGHEAWSNLCAGGTMGVVYGCGSVWNWRQSRDEDIPSWTVAPGASWHEAIHFEGSYYVGQLNKILEGLPMTDAAPDWTVTFKPRGLVRDGVFCLLYLEDGGDFPIIERQAHRIPRTYRIVDPRDGSITRKGEWTPDNRQLEVESGAPRVVLFFEGA